MVGAEQIVGVDINSKRQALAQKMGMTDFVNAQEFGDDLVAHLVELTKGGADYSFECVGDVKLMRQALECCHKGWDLHYYRGCWSRTRDFNPTISVGYWKSMEGLSIWRARGRTDVPRIVDWYMDGKINIDDLITYVLPIEQINNAFDLMHQGESIRTVLTF